MPSLKTPRFGLILTVLLFLSLASSPPIHAYGFSAHLLINELALQRFAEEIAAQDPILTQYDFYPTAEKYGLPPETGSLFLATGWTATKAGYFLAPEERQTHPFAWWVREGGFTADAPQIYMGTRH